MQEAHSFGFYLLQNVIFATLRFVYILFHGLFNFNYHLANLCGLFLRHTPYMLYYTETSCFKCHQLSSNVMVLFS